MKVYGYELTDRQIHSALQVMKKDTFTMQDVESALLEAGVPNCIQGDSQYIKFYVANRAADRILQKERNKVNIFFANKVWQQVPF